MLYDMIKPRLNFKKLPNRMCPIYAISNVGQLNPKLIINKPVNSTQHYINNH